MTTSTTSSKVAISSPKVSNAWSDIVTVSGVADIEIGKAQGVLSATVQAQLDIVTASILNLAKVMTKESGLSVRDVVKVIKEQGGESSFIKVSHVQALPTFARMRSTVEGFKALPLAKQLSTATASVELLGTGNGETLSLDALNSEIARERKNKNAKRSTPKDEPKKSKASNLDAIKAFTALIASLDFSNLSDAEAEALSNLSIILEDASISQA